MNKKNDRITNTNQETSRQYMTTHEASIYLRISSQTLEAYRCKGCGPNYFRLNRAVRYIKSDIDLWIDERKYSNTAAYSTGDTK